MSGKWRYTLRFADGRTEKLKLLGTPINRGADGAIYRSPDGRYAFKCYHEPGKDRTRQHKVWQMILHAPEDASAQHFAWPQAQLLKPRNEFVGFAMPLLDVASYVSLDLVLSTRGRQMQGLPHATAWRLDVAINLARRVAELHAKGHCIIDLKPANLLVHRHNADVAVVDCDGFAIRGHSEYFPAHQFTAGFIAPEAFRARQAPQALHQPQDRFALAVILFKLINGGLHPYQGVPDSKRDIPSDNQNRIAGDFYPYGLEPHPDLKPSPWSVHRDFPRIMREAFDASFTSMQRPSAQDWEELLEQAKVRSKTCAADGDHGYWGNECPHCVRANTRVKASKPKRQPFTPTPAPNAAVRPVAQPAPPAPATAHAPSAAPAAKGGIGSVISMAFFVVLLITVVMNSCSSSTTYTYAPTGVAPPSYKNPRWLAWKELGPELPPLYTVNRSAIYVSPSVTEEPIPYHRFGAFDQPESLSLLTRQPKSLNLLESASQGIRLERLDVPGQKLEALASYDASTPYGLALWQADPRPDHKGIYLPRCLKSCTLLQRLEPGRAPFSYRMPEWQHQGSDANYPEWRYLLSPEGEFLVMASASQVAVFAVDQPDKPLSVMNLPENYAGYSLGSLSVGPHGETMVLGIYKSERFGANFTSEILELTRNGRMMSLDSSFKPRAWAAGSELVGAFQTMSHDGQTLAVSEYQRVETNKTDFTILGSPITVTLGYPAISIWERDEHMQWRLRQRIEWKGRQGSGKLEIRPPLRTDLLTSWQIDGNKTFTAFQIHQNLQLSPDGRFLLSGVQTDRKFITLTVTSHLFDIQGNQPDLLGHMTMSVENASNSLIAYPHARLSESGNHVAMGWFLHNPASNGAKQTLHVQVFAVPKPEHTLDTAGAADVLP
jgi:hypothetical protein